jgi:hypothetical protein
MKKDRKQHLEFISDQHRHQYDEEIDFVDIVKVMWNQRWFITGLTMLIVALSVLYILIKTPLYEISAQISPGITDFDKDGNTIRSIVPNDIVVWFTEKGYANLFYENWPGGLPALMAKQISDSSSVRISYYCEKPDEGIKTISMILDDLTNGDNNYFKRELNVGKAILEQNIKGIEQTNKSLVNEKNKLRKIDWVRINNQIESTSEKLSILNKKIETNVHNKANAQKALESARKNLHRVNTNTEEIIALRKQMITDGADKIALLMYSNIIQQNIGYANNLQNEILQLNRQINDLTDEENDRLEEVDSLKTEIRNYILERDQVISLKQKEIDLQIENGIVEIDALKVKLHNLSIINIITPPTSSLKPLKPEKMKIVLLALFVGTTLSILASFLRSFWLHNKSKIMNEKVR